MLTTSEDLESARVRIAASCVKTPVLRLSSPDVESPLWLKAESLQRTGSFKLRGATNAIGLLDRARQIAGVVSHSSGNHGQAVACAASAAGISATVVMPETASRRKIELTRGWGARVLLCPAEETVRHAQKLASETGATLVPPFDDAGVIAGQGTVGLELIAQVPDLAVVLVPVGGGGLVSGVAAAVKQHLRHVSVIAVEPELASDLAEGFATGVRSFWSTDRTGRTIADGLRSAAVGELPWAHIRNYVDDVVTVSDDAIAEAMRRLAEDSKLVAEPSGAVATAAWLEHSDRLPKGVTAAIVTGGNVDLDAFFAITRG